MDSQFVAQENARRNQDRYPLAAETVPNRPNEMPEMKTSKRKQDANVSATLMPHSLQKEASRNVTTLVRCGDLNRRGSLARHFWFEYTQE